MAKFEDVLKNIHMCMKISGERNKKRQGISHEKSRNSRKVTRAPIRLPKTTSHFE